MGQGGKGSRVKGENLPERGIIKFGAEDIKITVFPSQQAVDTVDDDMTAIGDDAKLHPIQANKSSVFVFIIGLTEAQGIIFQFHAGLAVVVFGDTQKIHVLAGFCVLVAFGRCGGFFILVAIGIGGVGMNISKIKMQRLAADNGK